jgi:lysophospholipase L1-like esterase
LAIGILLLEGMLQAGAALVRLLGSDPSAFHTARLRILCLGDSNTYGVYLERERAYPKQFEALWNAAYPTAGVEVVNLGAPGLDTSRLRHELPRMIAATNPQVVLLMVGVNDFWTVPTPISERGVASPLTSVLGHSRLRRLLFSMRRAWQTVECDVVAEVGEEGRERGKTRVLCADQEFELPFQRREGSARGILVRLEENLRALVEEVSASGATPVLMTYPSSSSFYAAANRALRRVAHESGTPLVDLAESFMTVCPEEPCREWLFADHHPTAQGYALVSEILARALPEHGVLKRRDRVPPR